MVYETELYHHGVKGMKWGVRRYQNPDGTLTARGKKHYSGNTSSTSGSGIGKKKGLIQRRKDKLIERYIAKGYNPESAKALADQRVRTEAIVAIAGATLLTAAAIKGSTRIGQDYFDKTFKSGKLIQNIGANAAANFDDTPFFAAVNRADKRAYGMNYANEKRNLAKAFADKNGQQYQGIFRNQVQLTGDVKRASVRNAQKAFYDKMEQDPQFKRDVLDTLKKTAYNTSAAGDYEKSGKRTRALYDKFNQALATPEFQSAGIHKKYYDTLSKRGYNAVLDINDTRYSGYKKISKSPTIFFGSDKYAKLSSTKLSDVEITNNASKFVRGYLAKNETKKAAVWIGATAGLTSISKEQSIKSYLKAHPNSKLTRNEILKRIKEEQRA